jgi:hypothetical protein
MLVESSDDWFVVLEQRLHVGERRERIRQLQRNEIPVEIAVRQLAFCPVDPTLPRNVAPVCQFSVTSDATKSQS